VTVNVPPPPPKPFGQLMVDALPATIAGLIAAVVGALLAWTVGLRLSAGWDIRKKRAEFDQLLVQEFNKVVAEFKAIGREREVLKSRLADTQNATAEKQKAFEDARYELVKRAVATESTLETILLRLLSDLETWLITQGVTDAQKQEAREQQLRTMGLFRVAFRNLREAVAEGSHVTPGFNDPELWLFNRLAAELSGFIYERATAPSLPSFWRPWQITSVLAKPDPAAYLRLIAYRTADLRTAVASIVPDLALLDSHRRQGRYAQRRKNIEGLFDTTRFKLFESPAGRVEGDATLVIQFIDQAPDDNRDIAAVADRLFQSMPTLAYFMGVSDGPSRLVLVKRGGALRTLTELDPLPDDLPYATKPASPCLAVAILAWYQSQEMTDAIGAIATRSLSRS
jgi:hypothetical protein